MGDRRPALHQQLQHAEAAELVEHGPRSPERSRHGWTLAPPRPAENDPQRIRPVDVAHGQRRIVGPHGAGTDEDGRSLSARRRWASARARPR